MVWGKINVTVADDPAPVNYEEEIGAESLSTFTFETGLLITNHPSSLITTAIWLLKLPVSVLFKR
jgi:hypothetical protein